MLGGRTIDCNTFFQVSVAVLFAILHLELVHTYNMAVSVNCIGTNESHDVLT